MAFWNPFFVANDNRLHPIDVFSSPKKPSFANPPSPEPMSFFRHFGLLLFFSSPEHETLPIWNKPDPICTLALRKQNTFEPNENLRHRFTTLNFTGGNRLSLGTSKIEYFGQNVIITTHWCPFWRGQEVWRDHFFGGGVPLRDGVEKG